MKHYHASSDSRFLFELTFEFLFWLRDFNGTSRFFCTIERNVNIYLIILTVQKNLKAFCTVDMELSCTIKIIACLVEGGGKF